MDERNENGGNFGELPSGWTRAKVNDVVVKISTTARKIRQSEYEERGVLPVVDQGQRFVGGYTDKQELRIAIESPLIVFGDHTKVIKYINFDFVVGADGVKVLRPLEFFDPKLFYYFLHAVEIPEKGYARHFQFLEKAFIFVPPLAEQHRIVAKIEELFSDLDAGVAALKKTQAQLKRYRQAVLKAAVEGKLTAEWRAARRGETEPASVLLERIRAERAVRAIHESPQRDAAELGELPEGWEWVDLESLTTVLTDADHKMPKSQGTGIPYISTRDFIGEDEIDFLNAKLMSESDYVALSRKVKPEFSDILLSRYGTVGKVRKVNTRERFLASYSIAIIRPLPILDSTNYLVYALRSDIVQKQIKRDVRATAQPDLGLAHIRQFAIPVPPLAEQQQIVAEVERRLSVADEIAKTVDASLKQAERLRQSILKRAFAGKLVPQDPSDEPAERLLERIKAQRESRSTAPRQLGLPIPEVKKQRRRKK